MVKKCVVMSQSVVVDTKFIIFVVSKGMNLWRGCMRRSCGS